MARVSFMTLASNDVKSSSSTPPSPRSQPSTPPDKQMSFKPTHRYHPKMVLKSARSLLSWPLYCSALPRRNIPSQQRKHHHHHSQHQCCCNHSTETTITTCLDNLDPDRNSFSSSKETLPVNPMSMSNSPPSSPPRFRSSAGYGATTYLPENPKSPPLSPGGTSVMRIGSSHSSGSQPNSHARRPSTPNIPSNPTTIGSFSDMVRPVHDIHNPYIRLPKPTPGREHQDPRAAPVPGPSAGNIGGQMLGRYSRGEAHKGADVERLVGWKREEIEERRTEERIEQSYRDRWNKYLKEREKKERREAMEQEQAQRDSAGGSSRRSKDKSRRRSDHKCTIN
ncbi:hypothetical protein PV10_06074 [Exophiala mesophila]|uniref:Uncharacterized protein n=1 Tax=Exophiala mesophila TaxID=212818 RepID=A0A0D1WR27_EXOME|nr:uncharacterized protein PV10_06074 [Exophiala mesophila]KIV91545.1 hypothetical protein PV10_06074 [Exophiala mesophila]